MTTANEITVREIADAEELHYVHVLRVLRERGAPLPVRQIGKSKLYNVREVARFFLARRERNADQPRRHTPIKSGSARPT